MLMLLTEIKRLRQAKGLTQTQLAHLADVSLPTIQNIEAEKANPSLMVFEKILAALDAEIEIKSTQKVTVLELFNCSTAQFKNTPIHKTLKKIIHDFSSAKSERDLELSVALFMALIEHYPNWLKQKDFYSHCKQQCDMWLKKIDLNRHIKFRRLWLAKLSLVI